MSKLKQLLDQKADLERQIETTRREEKTEAINKVKALMAEYGLNLADLSMKSPAKAPSSKGGKVAAKYHKADTGDTWSGRGLQPKWLKAALASGRKLEEFAV